MRSADSIKFSSYKNKLHRLFGVYAVCLLLFLAAMAFAEKSGLSRQWVGAAFLLASIILYTTIGLYFRTTDVAEYYVAGRKIPAVYNGMATAADWMSAASFISLAGGLYLQGFAGAGSQPGGLAYVLGWTGGFVLLGLLVAPYLRGLNLYTVPDFFGWRYRSPWPRRIAAMASVLCSFTYVVAQIYGVGLITSRLTGVRFEIGILLGLSGVLVCSFLGGMRAVTWTQVAQYLILLLAFLIPVSWLSYKQLGNPAAPLVYGAQIQKISEREKQLMDDPAERAVVEAYLKAAKRFETKLQNVDASLAADRAAASDKLRALRAVGTDASAIFAASRELATLPKDANAARERWTRAMQDSLDRAKPLGGIPPISQVFAGDPEGTPAQQDQFDASRRNFLALMFCLMVGTMGLPHLLTRFYTTPSVSEARSSVAWALFFIALLYVSAPALAVLVKYEVMTSLVGLPFESLPAWMGQWAKLDPALLSVQDMNQDGILQFAELRLGADIIMLATPELGGLPYVVSGLVAAGGLAAALSTADGLLLTIGNTLAHDVYFRETDRTGRDNNPGQNGSDLGRKLDSHDSEMALATTRTNDATHATRLVVLSKFVLLSVALAAAYVAAQRPGEILFLVAASFSLAAAAFVPAMVLGIFSSRTTSLGAITGMLAGLGITTYYLAVNTPTFRAWLGLPAGGAQLWFGIQSISAGVFGVPLGFAVTWLVSRVGARTVAAA
jgi:cation/acetate symporter